MLAIDGLIYDAWGRRFFDEASVTLAPGMKAGLVGRNGAGKSTLFKLILGQLSPTGGDIRMPKGWRVATVDQEVAASPTLLLDAVLALDARRARLMAELETAPPERQGELHADLYAIDAERAPSRAAEILSGLGFTQADLARPMSDFSGGWRMRATLAGALLAEPDLLLLDEPTNYLDLEGALWLENRLKRYPNAALVISHDRELLNNSVGNIIHLRPTPSGGKLDLYTGGYDQFERQKAEKERLQAASNAKVEAQRAHLQSFVDRFRAKASKAAQAQSRLKMLAKLPPVTSAIEEHVAPFRLPSPKQPLSPPIVRMEGAAVGYSDRVVLRDLSLRLDLDDRIGLLGINGAGKSTFAKLLAGALKESHGEVWRDRRLKVGWFHQHQIEALDPRETAVDIIRRARPELGEAQRRAVLGSFGFSASRAETQALDLSGGERARLLLNIVAMDAPHLLILDEPTNHLDIDSRRALLDALNDFEGAVVLITHDRSLMELVADRLWLTADGGVRPFDGDMDDYARFVLDRSKTAARSEAAPSSPKGPSGKEARKAAADARARIQPLKKAADDLEARIEKLTRLIAAQNEQLEDEDLPPGRIIDIGREQVRAEKALAQAEADWLVAAEAYEAAKAEAGLT